MNTITLPDHISFEEIAAKWCTLDGCLGTTAIIYYEDKWELVYFYSDQDSEFCKTVFTVDMKTRELHEDDYNGKPYQISPILDYIRERSNV